MSTRATIPVTPTITARRFDVGGPLLRHFRRDSDGALLLEGYSSCETILEYHQPDGTVRRELVTREALLDSARTIARAPVTLDHPAEGFVRADNARKLAVGDVDGETAVEEAQGGFARVRVSLAVRHADAIDAVMAGKRELSEGYEVTLDPTPGEHPVLGRYDARQIGRKTNHLALVDVARAGPGAHVRVDSGDAWTRLPPLSEARPPTPSPSAPPDANPRAPSREDHGVPMNPQLVALLAALGVERVDNEDAALRDGLALVKRRKDAEEEAEKKAQDAEKEKQKADEEKEKADQEIEKLKQDLERVTGERDSLKAKIDEMEEEEKQKADAAELADLQKLATKVGVKHDGLALPALRLAIAKTRIDSVDDKTSAERIDGILTVIRADAARGDSRSRWAFPPRNDGGQRQDGNPQGGRRDDSWDPYLDSADAAFGGGK